MFFINNYYYWSATLHTEYVLFHLQHKSIQVNRPCPTFTDRGHKDLKKHPSWWIPSTIWKIQVSDGACKSINKDFLNKYYTQIMWWATSLLALKQYCLSGGIAFTEMQPICGKMQLSILKNTELLFFWTLEELNPTKVWDCRKIYY